MKIISDYSILCTLEQAKKALELGAPIEKKEIQLCDNAKNFFWYDGFYYNYPTAEEMIGFLEEQGILVSILYGYIVRYKWTYDLDSEEYIDYKRGEFTSREEATLAAIDAALGYLSNNK